MPTTPGSKDWNKIYQRLYVSVCILAFLVFVFAVILVNSQIRAAKRDKNLKSQLQATEELKNQVKRDADATVSLDTFLRGLVAQSGDSNTQEQVDRIESKIDRLLDTQ